MMAEALPQTRRIGVLWNPTTPGGLMSYGADPSYLYRRAAAYVAVYFARWVADLEN